MKVPPIAKIQTRDTTIKPETVWRSCAYDIRRENPDNKERKTYRASLSSEQTVDRYFGREKLIHTKDAIVLDRAESLPLLFNHNPNEPIGMIRDINIDNARLTGQLVFGNSQRAKDIEADVDEGLLSGISIGYRVLKIEEDTENDIFNVTRWELLEASVAPVAADPSVGIGRSDQTFIGYSNTTPAFISDTGNGFYISTTGTAPDNTYQATRTPKVSDKPNDANPVDDSQRATRAKPSHNQRAKTMEDETENIDIVAIEAKASERERYRIRDITAFGDKFNCAGLAQEYITQNRSVEDFRAKLLETINPNPQPLAQPAAEDTADIGMTDKEVRQFSFCRALAYLSDPQNPRMQQLAAFEIECSRAAADKTGKRTSGIMVPENRDWFVIDKRSGQQTDPNMDYRSRNFTIPNDVITRDLSAGTATAGQELVSTDLLAGSFIDVLRNMLVVRMAGATILDGLVGDIAIPRKTSPSSAVWVAEGANVTQSDMAFDQVTLSPKTAGSYTEYTRQLLLQSSLSVENLVRMDLAAGLATTIDLACLYGTGASGQPTGILNTSGINTVTAFAGANPTWAEVITLESAVDVDNALMGSLSYIMRADMKGALKSTEKATNTAQFIYESDNTMNGYPVYVSQQVTSGDLFFANWADMLIGLWGGLDLLVDPYTNSLSGTIRVVGHQSVDVAVRHPVSFAYGT